MLPSLPALPQTVDPDAWLTAIDGHIFVRKVGHDGCVTVDLASYYISQQVIGQYMARPRASSRANLCRSLMARACSKRCSSNTSTGNRCALSDYLALMVQEALAEERRLSASQRHLHETFAVVRLSLDEKRRGAQRTGTPSSSAAWQNCWSGVPSRVLSMPFSHCFCSPQPRQYAPLVPLSMPSNLNKEKIFFCFFINLI